ncbi:integrase core domain-containing protein [Phthorimaea operculella]|nr:integrase core domain-containing protein [Phthorimaea operculella]
MGVSSSRSLNEKLERLNEYQMMDNIIMNIRQRVLELNGLGEDRLGRIASRCSLINGILYYDPPNVDRQVIFLPEILREETCKQVHIEMGHLGVYKTYHYIRQRFYWIGMKTTVRSVIRKCRVCQLSKDDPIKYVGPCNSIVTEGIGDLVMGDLYGPLPRAQSRYSYIFVLQDSFSKYIKLYGLSRATSRAVLKKLKEFVRIIKPKIVMTDNGRQFISMIWRTGLRELGIRALYTSIRNPRPNTTERVNKELSKYFRIFYHHNHKGWYKILGDVEELYNNTYHNSTKYSPKEIVFGSSARLTIDRVLPHFENTRDVETIREEVKENLRQAGQIRREFYNKTHRLIEFQVGDLVKIRKLNKSDTRKSLFKKFKLRFEGPYRVLIRKPGNIYVLVDPDRLTVRGTFSAIHLLRYYV